MSPPNRDFLHYFQKGVKLREEVGEDGAALVLKDNLTEDLGISGEIAKGLAREVLAGNSATFVRLSGGQKEVTKEVGTPKQEINVIEMLDHLGASLTKANIQGTEINVLSKSASDFVIYGPASVAIVDKDNDLITGPALRKALPQLLLRGKISLNHTDVLVGSILEKYDHDGKTYLTEVRPLTKADFKTFDWLEKAGAKEGDDALFVVAKIHDDTPFSKDVREKIEAGKLRAFSITGQAIVQGKKMDCSGFACKWTNEITDVALSAVTVCAIPANQAAGHIIIRKSWECQIHGVATSCFLKMFPEEHAKGLLEAIKAKAACSCMSEDSISKAYPTEGSEPHGVKIGNPAAPQGSQVTNTPSKDAATKKIEGDLEYPAGVDRTHDASNDDINTGKRPSGYYGDVIVKELQGVKDALTKQDIKIEIITDSLLTAQDVLDALTAPIPEITSALEESAKEVVEESVEDGVAKNWVPHTTQSGQPAAKNLISGDIKYGEEARRLLSGRGRAVGAAQGVAGDKSLTESDVNSPSGSGRIAGNELNAARLAERRQASQSASANMRNEPARALTAHTQPYHMSHEGKGPAYDAAMQEAYGRGIAPHPVSQIASAADTYQQAAVAESKPTIRDAMASNTDFEARGGKLPSSQPLHPDYISEEEVQREIASMRGQSGGNAPSQPSPDNNWEYAVGSDWSDAPVKPNPAIPGTYHDADVGDARAATGSMEQRAAHLQGQYPNVAERVGTALRAAQNYHGGDPVLGHGMMDELEAMNKPGYVHPNRRGERYAPPENTGATRFPKNMDQNVPQSPDAQRYADSRRAGMDPYVGDRVSNSELGREFRERRLGQYRQIGWANMSAQERAEFPELEPPTDTKQKSVPMLTSIEKHDPEVAAAISKLVQKGVSEELAHTLAFAAIKKNKSECMICFRTTQKYHRPELYYDVVKAALFHGVNREGILPRSDFFTFKRELPLLREYAQLLKE